MLTDAPLARVSGAQRLHVTYTPDEAGRHPATLILKQADAASADHHIALALHLYDREWHFYESLATRVPVRVPKCYGMLKSETSSQAQGVLLEDLCVPGANHSFKHSFNHSIQSFT